MRANKVWTTAAAAALFVCAIAIVFRWLWTDAFLSEFHSDTADTLFWAIASRESGRIGSLTFRYGYFIPFGGNLLVQPFLSVLGEGVSALRAGMTLFALLFAFASYRLFRSFRWSRTAALLSSVFVFAVAFATSKMREIYFGHVLYYSLGTLFLFLGCPCATESMEEEETYTLRRRILYGLALVLCMAWAAACGKPMLLYAAAPVLGSWVLVRLFDEKPLSPLRDGLRLLPGIVGVAIGVAVFSIVSRNVQDSDYTGLYEAFSPVRSWWKNWGGISSHWISLLDDLPNARIPIAGKAGIPHAIRIAAAILTIAAPIAALTRIRSFSKQERIFLAAHWILTGEILVYWVFGNISDANWRLCPVVLSATVVTACWVRNLFVYGSIRERRLSSLSGLLLLGFCFLSFVQPCRAPCHWNAWNGKAALLPTLESIGIRDGYCPDYWFANAVTAVSESRFRIREVRLDDKGKWQPRLHNSDDRWYKPDPSRTKTVFICASRVENLAPTNNVSGRFVCYQRFGRPARTEELVVLVYDDDCLNPRQKALPQ